MNSPKNYFSNRTEALYEELKKNLFHLNSAPFARRLVVVPSPAMKTWLMMRLAKDPEITIATGLEISYLDATLQKLQSIGKLPQESSRLNSLELSFAIEKEIRLLVASCNTLTSQEFSIWLPLFQYLKVTESSLVLTKKNESRLTSLSDTLARLFFKYGKYGSRLVASWEDTETKEWQILLWKRLFNVWEYPYKDIYQANNEKSLLAFSRQDIQVHLFALSHIPDLFFDYFIKVSQQLPVYFYMLSPCQMFWSDLISDKDSRYLLNSLRKNKASEQQLEALQEYLMDKNSFLGNLGKIGQKMAVKIENSLAQSTDSYIALDSIKTLSAYQDLYADELLFETPTDTSITMLEALQTDLLLLRQPETTPKVLLSPDDQSVQVHIAPNKKREVEILHDTLVAIIQNHAQQTPPIFPSDILIMCPDLESYAPYIKAVFDNDESLLKAQIFDQSAPSQSLILQSFMHLLSLPFSRWEVTSMLQLFECPAFQKRQKLKKEEVESIKEWIELGDIRWGADCDHRNNLLKRDHCSFNMVENSQNGTWEFAMGRIISGLVLDVSTLHNSDGLMQAFPIAIDYSKEVLLGKWIHLLRSLKQDLKILTDGTVMKIADWGKYLCSLYEGYFLEDESKDNVEIEILKEYFEQLQLVENKIGKTTFSFSTIHYYLKAHLEKPVENYRDAEPNTVKFCAMLPMRAIPSSVVGLLGLSEEVYPRNEGSNSLNLLSQSTLADYVPTQPDFDRFLFLEAILSAKKYFITSYCSTLGENKPPSPSLILTELLSYLDKAFQIDVTGCLSSYKPSEHITKEHPFYAFDKVYFSEASNFKSFSRQQFLAAKAFYRSDKEPSVNFLSLFTKVEIAKEHEPVLKISLKELVAFAKNPLKTYFNKTLGIYLDRVDDAIQKDDEDFQLSHLQNFMMKKAALKHSAEMIVNRAAQFGHLPVGPFKNISLEKFNYEVQLLQTHLKNLGISPSDIFQVHFSSRYTKIEQNKRGDWQFPSLKIPYRGMVVELTGTFQEVSPSGLIVRYKDDRQDVSKVWPEYLIYCSLIEQNQLSWLPHLLFVNGKKAGVKQPFFKSADKLLEDYLDYYFIGKENVSPLIPEWISDIVTSDFQTFKVKIEQSLTNRFQPLYNEYLQWGLRNTLIPDAESIFHHWQPTAKLLFSDVLEKWY